MLNELERFNIAQQEIPPGVQQAIPELFEGYKNSMINAAISAEKRAKHHSNLRVGCSLLALGKNFDLSTPGLYTGANEKPNKGMLAYPERQCAEMQALMSVLAEQNGNDEGEIEKGELKEGGLVAVIVTVSESRNTGEPDTVDHDILYPCKQCQTNYEYLLSKGRLSNETIIYNIRTKGGKPVAGEPMTLKALLEKFDGEKEQMNFRSVNEMLQVRKEAIEEYKKRLASIKVEFSPGAEKINRDLQREKVEESLEAMDICMHKISNAVKSATEEGVEKQRILDSLALSEIPLDNSKKGFSERELSLILRVVQERLLKDFTEDV